MVPLPWALPFRLQFVWGFLYGAFFFRTGKTQGVYCIFAGLELQNWKKTNFFWIYRSRLRKKWITQCMYGFCFPVWSSKHCALASEPGKTVNTLRFQVFPEFGGSWMYRLRIGSGPVQIAKKLENDRVFTVFSGLEPKTLRLGFQRA